MSTLRLVLADDHPVVLHGLQSLLGLESDLEVVAVGTDGIEAAEAIYLYRPDVLVLDSGMPGCDGLTTVRQLREEGQTVAVVVLAASLDDATLAGFLRASVEAVVLKESAASDLVQAIRAAARGKRWISAGITNRVLEILAGSGEDGLYEITRREKEISILVASGKSNRKVAQTLQISESTVKMHLHSVFSKLGIANRVELSLVARERGWI